MNKTNNFFLYIALVSIGLSSCASLRYHQPDQVQSQAAQDIYSESDDQLTLAPRTSTSKEALQFIQRHRDPKLKMDQADYDFIQSIYPVQAETAEEAAFTIAITKHALYGDTSKKLVAQQDTSGIITSFGRNQQSLKNQNSNNTTGIRSVERVASDVDFDFINALDNNLILRSHDFSALALLTARETQNTSGFNNSIANVIQKRAEYWNTIQSNVRPEDVAAMNENSADENNPYDQNFTGERRMATESIPYQEPNLGIGDIQQMSSSMADTDNLIAAGNYREAIAKIRAIPPSDPSYEQGQEKIQSIRNKAVRELRSKAAVAYQNSLPVMDKKVKRSFLMEARDYLNTALSEFANDRQREKLQNNLNVISRELALIDGKGNSVKF